MANLGIGGWESLPETRSRSVVLKLGSRVRLGTLTNIPSRYRIRASQLNGRLGTIFLAAATGDIWCRLDSGIGAQVWPPRIHRIDARTIPLNDKQAVTPIPGVIELQHHMIAQCEDGEFGRLYGIGIDTSQGIATSLVVRVRSSFSLTSSNDPMGDFLPKVGQLLLVPANWVVETSSVNGSRLGIAASAHQVAHGLLLRDDAEMLQDVWQILGKNPALAPYISQLRVNVMDGTVTIAGPVLSPRLRASLEQDIWHIPGVLNVRNLIRQS